MTDQMEVEDINFLMGVEAVFLAQICRILVVGFLSLRFLGLLVLLADQYSV